MKRLDPFVFLALGLCFCLAAAAADPTPPKLRLPDTARPLRYALDLTIVPEEDSFQGVVEVEVELAEAASFLWMNGKELAIDHADVSASGASLAARPVPGGAEFVGFDFGRPVGPGRAKLRIRYRGKLEQTDTHGLFKQKEGGDWYAFSQFEATEARRAFPCFDEPSYKVPWKLTLHVKREHVAVSNTPILKEIASADGMKTVRFAETKPLPSYLVALAVGPFDVLDAGTMGRKKTPHRILTPRGRAAEARYVAEIAPEIFSRLETYFGVPYPYEKLDHVAIPETVAFSAMENAGMITCSQSRLLNKPEDLAVGQRRGLASLIAHELAHQWFGDLVTLAYWDDVWLNESFASWMGSKVVDEWKPEWEGEVRRLGSRSRAMGEDSLVTARRIRQPIATQDDIENAFDAITYGKGATVLAMFEAWMGPERFRKGVQRYLREHAFGNATASDFLAALSAAGGGDVGSAFSTFLDQAGVPLLTADLRCEEGAPRLRLSQKRFLPAGSEGNSDQLWRVPVSVRYGLGEKQERVSTLMTARTTELALGSVGGCPEWILANEGGRGYYVVSLQGDLLRRLLADGGKRLTLPERVGLLDDVRALVSAGEIPVGDALKMVPALAKDPSRHIVDRAARIVENLEDHLVPEDLKPNYARFVRQTFGDRALELGLTEKAGEDDDTKLVRESLVPLVADDGEDRVLREEAGKLARRWLVDRKAVAPDMADTVLGLAALDGDRDLFDLYRSEAKKISDRRERRWLLSAMGSFRDPEIVRAALSLVLSDEFDIRQSTRILWTGLRDPGSRNLVYQFVKQNFDSLASRMPTEAGAFLFSMGGVFCDEEHRDDAERFFRERVGKFPGAPRNLDQALESISLCIASRRAQQPGVVEFLRGY